MKKIAFLLAAAVVGAAPAAAQRLVDVETLTCRELVSMDPTMSGGVMLWLHGYLSDQQSINIMHPEELDIFFQQLPERCLSQPNALVIEVGDLIPRQ